MKIIKRVTGLLLCAMLAIGLTACGEPENDNPDEPKEDPSTIVYSDFEEWAPDFQTIRMTPYSGALHVNKDKKYAKDNQSLLIHPLGRYTSGGNATFIFPTYSELFEFDYRDFTRTTSISFEFYNAENQVKKVAVGLTPVINSTESFTYTKYQWQELAPDAWTTITYEVDIAALGFVYDVTDIEGFYMTFENAGSRDEEDAPDIYLDNIVIHKLTYDPPKTESFTLGEMEYLDFEDTLQNGMIEVGGRAGQEAYIVKAADETVNGNQLKATSGENVLKMEFQPVDEVSSNFSYILTSNIVTQNSMFAKIDSDDAANMVIAFDIYNANDESMYIEFDFRQYDDCMFGGFYVEPHTWMTFRYRLDDVLARYSTFAQYGKLQFVMSEFAGNKSKVFYLDNIRFEWATDLSTNR